MVDELELAELLREADAALGAAKRGGKGAVEWADAGEGVCRSLKPEL